MGNTVGWDTMALLEEARSPGVTRGAVKVALVARNSP